MSISLYTQVVARGSVIPAVDRRLKAYLEARAAEVHNEGPAAQKVDKQQTIASDPETDPQTKAD